MVDKSGYPKVIVLLLNWNGRDLMKDSCESYLNNDYPNFEVVMIDNGSTDDSVDYVKTNFPGVIILRNERNLGYSGGFNVGLNYAFNQNNADYVLISNNDVKADHKVISELVKVAESDDTIGFATGKVFYYDHPNILQTVGKKSDPVRWNGGDIGVREEDRGQYDEISEREFADDIYTLVRKKLYRKIGGYNTTFFLQCEEYDWQARAKKKGYRIMFTPFAKIWHKDSMTLGKTSPLKSYYDARNPMIVILKHKSPDYFRKYFWLHLRKDVFKGSIKVILKGLEIIKAYKMWMGFFSGILWGIKNKLFTIRHFI
ncbi:MAG: glycosyltransferase family 2 protein [Candidatus Aminicenantes bacterium]|nr:MAG: glycosyltransferase family 2 protein [Candidatus Aminicenantes bacterium]